MGCICETLAKEGMKVSSVCIGQLWVFNDLKREELEAIANRALRKKYSAGENIFFQGDPANRMFLIKAGRVKLTKFLEEGSEITLDIRKAGDFLGENMLTEDTDYPVTATSMEETMICGFTKESFEKLVLDYSNIGLQVIKNLSKRISFLTSRVGSMSLSNLANRLYDVLVNVSREHGVKERKGFSIPFPLTHEELSFLVGAHRVSITRAMKDLKESGRVVQEGKRIILPPSKLY